MIKRGCYAGACVSGGLSIFTQLTKSKVLRGLTSDPAVRAACEAVFPIVMLCQVGVMHLVPIAACVMLVTKNGLTGSSLPFA